MDQIQSALETYFAAWDNFKAQAIGYDFASVKPMHVGWKVSGDAEFSGQLGQLLQFAEQGHLYTIHNRKIMILVLKQPIEGVPCMQIVQRRPGGSEAIGLDHVAFYCKDLAALATALSKTDYKWEKIDGQDHQWVSLRFDGGMEAKFFDVTMLQIAAQELREASDAIIA